MSTPYYQDDHVTIYHGDCREVDAWLTADVLVTDPPYGIAWSKGEYKRESGRAHAGIANDEDTSARDAALVAWGEHRPAVVFGSLYAPPPLGVLQTLIWHKPNDAGLFGCVTGFRRDVEPVFIRGTNFPRRTAHRSSVLRSNIANIGSPNSPAGRTGHPHAKPDDLMRELIGLFDDDAVIADPFMGSGTTLRAAKDLGRKAIGIEIDERYCEIAARRMGQEVLPL